MKYKTYNPMFMDAEYSFSMLKFYYKEMTSLLGSRADDFHKYTDELEEDHKKRQLPFDKEYWLKHYDVYAAYYPHMFNNSFIISACALFEFHVRKICALVKKEHKVPLEWDDMKGSIPKRAKSFLWVGGIQLRDDPPNSFQYWLSGNLAGEKKVAVKKMWQELDDYFAVRNCITHHNGQVQRLRYPERIVKYGSRKGIIENNKGMRELSLNQDFNREVCDTMMEFFSKITSAYYGTPLPE